jgi:hypothetical protein
MTTSEDQLSDQERRIVSATRTGQMVDLRIGHPDDDDPAGGASWDESRTVSAGLLIELLTAERAAEIGRPRAVRIQGARITGPLDLEACTLVCPLLLRGCHIDEPMNLNEATAAAIRLPGCHVPRLSARQLHTTGNLELTEGFTAKDGVSLPGAHIGGRLDLSGAHLTGAGGRALAAESLAVEQSMLCREGFTAEGEVDLLGAHIGGQLDLSGAHLTGAGGRALNADGLAVDQSMLCREGFTAEGELNLPGAHIGGQLDLSGAQLTNRAGRALNAELLTVAQGMLCREGFTAEGEVRLLGAQISGQLVLTGALLHNRDGTALNADGLTVDQGMYCSDWFTTVGEVDLRGAHIGRVLSFSDAFLNNPKGFALTLQGVRADELDFRPVRPPDGTVDFTNARVGLFHDDQLTWPVELWLGGFTYETVENDQISVRDRLRWLTLHPGGYIPQTYDQLAAAYRRAGQVEAARKVGVAKQRRRRSVLSPLNWLLYLTVGYGYRTWLAGVWLVALTAVGARVFARAHPHHMIQATPKAPAFHALVYTLDVLLPVVDLGQEKAWVPQGWAQHWSWFFMAAGWFLTTAAVAGLTGIFKRD